MYKNYIFDLYGTLADIHTDEETLFFWKKMALYFSLKGVLYAPEELKERYHTFIRNETQTARKRFFPIRPDAIPEINIHSVFYNLYADRAHSPSDAEIRETALVFRMLSIKRLRLFSGVKEVLQSLKKNGHQAYLLSNAQALFTCPEIDLLGLTPYFDGILLSSDAGIKKPDPVFYQQLLEQFHLNTSESVMIGNDDIADCHGASGIGMDSIYIHTRQSPEQTRPLPDNCRKVKHIKEVLRIL